MIEEKDNSPTVTLPETGGLYTNTKQSGSTNLQWHHGYYQRFTPGTAALDVRLPDIRGFDMSPDVLGLENSLPTEASGPHFVVENAGTENVTLKETWSNAWRSVTGGNATVLPGQIRRLYIGDGIWRVSL
jgi:hypothetical protein